MAILSWLYGIFVLISCPGCPYLDVLFATVPDSSINSWESWFIFNLRKINSNQYYESDSLDAGICTRYKNTRYYKTTNAYNYCTYLNSGLLEAPCEYVLHGLVPGLNWAPSWPLHMSMYFVTTVPQPSILLFIVMGQVSHLAPSAIWVASH